MLMLSIGLIVWSVYFPNQAVALYILLPIVDFLIPEKGRKIDTSEGEK